MKDFLLHHPPKKKQLSLYIKVSITLNCLTEIFFYHHSTKYMKKTLQRPDFTQFESKVMVISNDKKHEHSYNTLRLGP